MDVVFLLDFSGSVDTSYAMSLAFIRRVLYGMQFKLGRMRASFASFSDRAAVHFRLNTYSEQRDVLNALSVAFLDGETNMALALTTARDDLLSSGAGNRQGVADLVVLLTDGYSTVNDGEVAVQAAARLKGDGVTIAVVAIGPAVDMQQVNAIASFDGRDVYSVEGAGEAIEQQSARLLDFMCQ